jgi:hypothetical protein
MHSSNCPNCAAALKPSQHFCGQCGQKAPTHRITVGHFLHEFFHAFTHTDKGIFHLLKSLTLRPGATAKEYIRGKRKSYFSPFTFFLIIMAVYVLADAFFLKTPPAREPDAQVLAHIPTEAGRQKYVVMMERGNKVSEFMAHKANLVAMVAVPLVAFITWLFFFRRGYNYAEHLTANMMFLVFSNLVFVLLIFPLQAAFRGSAAGRWLPMLGLLLQALYLFWCLNGFLDLRSAGGRTKSLLVSLFSIVLWFFFSLTMMALYIYRNGDFYQFYGRMF